MIWLIYTYGKHMDNLRIISMFDIPSGYFSYSELENGLVFFPVVHL